MRHAATDAAFAATPSSRGRSRRPPGRSRPRGSRRPGARPRRTCARSRARARSCRPTAEVDLAGQRDVAVLGAFVFPLHAPVHLEIAPAVGYADESGRSLQPVGRRGQRQRRAVALGEQHRAPLEVADPRRVARAAVAQVRRGEREERVVGDRAAEGGELHALQHHLAPRVGDDLLLDPVAPFTAGVRQPERGNAVGKRDDFVLRVALLL